MACETRAPAARVPSRDGAAHGAEITVMISGGFHAAYCLLAPEFERLTNNRLATVRGPSMGNTPQAIANRLQRGEAADVVIMAAAALDELAKHGKVVADSRVELAHSRIGVAVRKGAPKPDIGSVAALKRALISVESIAYSSSASGVYVSTTLFPRLGLAGALAGKCRVSLEPVGAVVARGEADIGFQQLSELLAVAGVDVVGPLPSEVQHVTVFSAAIATGTRKHRAATALLDFLASPQAAVAIVKSGLDPAGSLAA